MKRKTLVQRNNKLCMIEGKMEEMYRREKISTSYICVSTGERRKSSSRRRRRRRRRRRERERERAVSYTHLTLPTKDCV